MVAIASPIAVAGNRPTCYSSILLNNADGEDQGQFATGMICLVAKASAAIKIGDSVYLDGAGTVNISTVAGNQTLRTGICVGGVPRTVTGGAREVIQRLSDVGLQAAAIGDDVLIAIAGLCYVVCTGAITVGQHVKSSVATAGRVVVATIATDAGKIIGQAWDASAGDGNVIRINVSLM